MMPAILWKEYREHRIIWAALALVSAATVPTLSSGVAAAWFGAQADGQEGRFVAVALAGAYALICGAMMLAGERENGTMSYLDALPGFRQRLWQGKFVAALALVLGQIILLMFLCAAFSLFKNWNQAGWTLAAMLLVGIYGLSWGMLFSSFGHSVINVILLSLAALAGLAIITGPLAQLFAALTSAIYGIPYDVSSVVIYLTGLFALAAPVALVGSARVFTELDRRRLRGVPKTLRVRNRTARSSWSMLIWLTWRQARGFAAGLAFFVLFLGFVILLQPFLLWPAATLIVGVLCGATAFADEQQGSFRFLGDQRLPLGRLWLVKVGVRFGIAVVAALLVLAPSFIGAIYNIPASRWENPQGPYYFFAHVFHSDLLVELCPSGLFLTLWLLYGFSSGCLFGLLFRNGLAAGVFALFTCALTAALWIPSLLGGGLHAWQVFGPPVLILIAARLLMRPWATGRIASWATALRLTPFVILAGLWIAGGLYYRVLEIPYVPQRVDLTAFRASLPTPEQDEGGQLFRSACLRFDALRRTLESQQMFQGAVPGAMPPGVPGVMPPAPAGGPPGGAGPGPMPGAPDGQPPALPPMERASDALDRGWPADDHDLAAWLDKLYAGEWPAMLEKATELPTSPFDDVRNMTASSLLPATQPARELAVVLVARGLQRQAAGDDEAYVENLRIGLGLSRSLRDDTHAGDVLVGRAIQGVLLKGMDQWLERLHGRSDLIGKALALLSRHLDETAADAKDQELIEDLVIENTVENPFPFVQLYLTSQGSLIKTDGDQVRQEATWVVMAWLVPWERARQARILRVMFDRERTHGLENWIYHHREALGPLPLLGPTHFSLSSSLQPLCAAHATQLKLALRWYQADNGKPAENLDVLVPKYLPSIPLDPYDDEPFRYRLSRGEVIVWPPDSNASPPGPADVRKIPPGQGVLWSVGEDKVDDGGHRQVGPSDGPPAPGEDLIYLVPLPAKEK